jgi:hypothetical protein
MPRTRAALAALLLAIAIATATGCGSDDDSKSDSSAKPAQKPGTKSAEKSDDTSKDTSDDASAAPKASGARGKLTSCLDREGIDVSHEGQDAATATTYTLKARSGEGDKTDAVVKIHSSRDEAASSARRAGEERGINAVAFGRAEFIRRAATDNEAGTIVNCVSLAYGG